MRFKGIHMVHKVSIGKIKSKRVYNEIILTKRLFLAAARACSLYYPTSGLVGPYGK